MKPIRLLPIIATVLLTSCTSTSWVGTPIAKQHEFVITLEQQQNGAAAAQIDHVEASDITLADIGTLMGDLAYIEKTGLLSSDNRVPVFQQSEISHLAPVLADALAKSKAGQRIRFISFNLGQAALFSQSQKTEGVIFLDAGGRLNLAFNYINAKRLPNETSALYSHHSAIDPLTISTTDTPLSAVAPYMELHTSTTGQQAPLWVVVNLHKLRENIRATTTSERAITPGSVSDGQTSSSPSPPLDERNSPMPASGTTRESDLKDKLRFLRELRDDGLISEQDYNAKKAELLEKIH